MTLPVPLIAHQVTKRFGTFVAVDDLTLELPPGTVTDFLGPNGAGKSTTLRIAGADPPALETKSRPSTTTGLFGTTNGDPGPLRGYGVVMTEPITVFLCDD